jgi:lipopolysaccharide exporter
MRWLVGHSRMSDRVAAPVSVSTRAAIGAGWIIAWRMVSRNLGLISTLVLVRLLQPSDFGLVALASGLIASVDSLSAIGVVDALIRAHEPDRDMYDTGFALNALRSVATALVIALIAWPVGDFFGDSRLAVVMLALSVGTLLGAAENIGTVDFRRNLDFHKEFSLNVWTRLAGVLATVATAAIWHSYWALVVGLLLMRVIRIPLSYSMSPYRPRFTVRAWRRIIGFSLWTWAQAILSQVRERSDSVVIGRFLGTNQFGMFAVGLELGALPTTELIEPLGRALFSGFASLHNAAEGLGNMFRGAVGLGFMVVLPAGIGISMVAEPMVRLTLGEQWLAAVPVVQIMAVAATSAIFIQPCGTLLNAIGRPQINFYLVAVSTVVKVAVLLVLVPRFGLQGAAVSLAISGILDMVLFLAVTLPRIDVSVGQLSTCVIRPIFGSAAMVALLWSLGMAWTPSQGTDFLGFGWDAAVRSTIGAICYVIVLIGSWFIAGRPDGAERYALTTASAMWTRVRRWALGTTITSVPAERIPSSSSR